MRVALLLTALLPILAWARATPAAEITTKDGGRIRGAVRRERGRVLVNPYGSHAPSTTYGVVDLAPASVGAVEPDEVDLRHRLDAAAADDVSERIVLLAAARRGRFQDLAETRAARRHPKATGAGPRSGFDAWVTELERAWLGDPAWADVGPQVEEARRRRILVGGGVDADGAWAELLRRGSLALHSATMTAAPPEQTKALLVRVRGILRQQDAWRGHCLNLIASENVMSPAARAVIDSDLLHRYAEGHPGVRYYEGTRYVDEVETLCNDVMRRVFHAQWADVRPISGTVANEAVFSRLVPQGAVAIAHTVASGGHISHARIGSLGKRTNRILPWPMSADGWRIDVEAARDLIARERPPLVVLGRSLFLFPEPVADLQEICREVGTRIFYDGAHVLGLIAGGTFQDPLREGADVLAGSTHKTFFGPQRGVLLSNSEDEDITRRVDRGVFPGSSSNHHLFTLPALLVSALEMETFGLDYARATILNAQALGRALNDQGLDVAAADLGYTASHQVAVDVGAHGGGKAVSRRLSDQDIICNMNLLPGEPAKNALDPRGIRLGVQEMTRYGMGPAEMREMADLMHAAITGSRDVRGEVRALRERFPRVWYGFQAEDLA